VQDHSLVAELSENATLYGFCYGIEYFVGKHLRSHIGARLEVGDEREAADDN